MKPLLLTVLAGIYFLGGNKPGLAQPSVKTQVMTPRLTKRLIDSVEHSLQQYYIFSDKAALMGKHLRDQFKKGRYRAFTDPYHLAGQLAQDLQAVHPDGHLFIRYDPEFAQALQEVKSTERRIDDSVALRNARDENFGLNRVEILDGNIGYLPIYSFTSFVEQARPAFSSALRFLSRTQALILDVRYNGGGSPEMVAQAGSYFFSVRTPFTMIENRVRNSTTTYWADPAQADSLNLSMPVYILTSRSTFSAAEDFSYSMQQAKRALVVGDTTGGGAHPARPFLLGQGFLINLPFAQSINPYSKTNWEGIGVRPDIPVKADRAVEKVQELILDQALAQAQTDGEKRKLQWALHEMKARQNEILPPVADLAPYTGDYQGLIVYIQEDHLFCKNTGRGDQITQLKPISVDWFTLNEQVHLEFLKQTGGGFSGLKLHWRDGREIPVDKSK